MPHATTSWKENEVVSESESSGWRVPTAVWVGVPIVLVIIALIVWLCLRRRRIIKRAKQARQDEVLNLPIATPWEASAVPYARVVDIAATAPDHDELLPATAPTFDIQTQRTR